MLTLPSELIVEKNKLYTSGACIELLEIQLSEASETLRLTSNNAAVVYDSETWSPFPFESGDIPEDGGGELPRVNIKVSKGTTNSDEMARMMKATKDLLVGVLGNSDETNYFIIDELNSDGWGFDGLSMTDRGKMEH